MSNIYYSIINFLPLLQLFNFPFLQFRKLVSARINPRDFRHEQDMQPVALRENVRRTVRFCI